MRKVLVVSAHPDDEVLGTGGTILKHKKHGDEIYWLIITKTFKPKWTSDIIKKKNNEIKLVSSSFGVEKTFNLGFHSTNLNSSNQNDLIEKIRDVIMKVKPNTVYVPNKRDVHSDHFYSFKAVMTILKSFYMKRFGVERILSYETLSSTEAAPPQDYNTFLPNIYNDITPYIEKKIQIMNLYKTERHDDPFPRGPSSIRALARHRGATIGIDYAEAFMLIREVN